MQAFVQYINNVGSGRDGSHQNIPHWVRLDLSGLCTLTDVVVVVVVVSCVSLPTAGHAG